MKSTIAPVAALLLSVAILLTGNGLQGTLLPIRAGFENFTSFDIGVLGSAYFVGFALGCFYGPQVVRRVGHIRTFTAMVCIATTTVLEHGLVTEPAIWWPLRAITGFCFAVLYMVIESWLNERATNETRGAIFSIYTIINLTVLTLGQLMMTLADPAEYTLFALSAILLSLAAVPVALTGSQAPAPIHAVRLRLAKLYNTSPVGFAGSLVVGFTNGSFWALAPVFAQRIGMTIGEVAIFMSVTVIAGALSQAPFGYLSDRTDRRRVIAFICLAAGAAGAAMTVFSAGESTVILAIGFAFGAFAFPVYALSVAHTNDHVAPEDYVETSSGLLLVYAAGAVAGPLIASVAMEWLGPQALFGYTAICHVGFALFAVYRIGRREAAPEETRRDFADTALGAQTVAPIDPAADTDKEEAAAASGRSAQDLPPG